MEAVRYKFRQKRKNYKKEEASYFKRPLKDLTNHSQKTLVCKIFT